MRLPLSLRGKEGQLSDETWAAQGIPHVPVYECWEGKAPTEYCRTSISIRRIVSTTLRCTESISAARPFLPWRARARVWSGLRKVGWSLAITSLKCASCSGEASDGWHEAGSDKQPPEPKAQMLTTVHSSGAVTEGLGHLGHLKELSQDWHSCCLLLSRLLGGSGLHVGYTVACSKDRSVPETLFPLPTLKMYSAGSFC